MNSRDTDKFPFGLGSTKSCSLLFQYQLGFILIFALVFNIHGMQVFYFIVVLNDDTGNMYVSGSALIAIFLVKKLIYQNELDYIMLFFLLHKVVYCFVSESILIRQHLCERYWSVSWWAFSNAPCSVFNLFGTKTVFSGKNSFLATI